MSGLLVLGRASSTRFLANAQLQARTGIHTDTATSTSASAIATSLLRISNHMIRKVNSSMLVIKRGKHIGAIPKRRKRAAVMTARKSSAGTKNSSTNFGLERIDYSVPPPISKIPPAPPQKTGVRGLVPFIPAGLVVALTAYVYFNNSNDSYDYWRAMQTGNIVLPIGLGDDYDDDEDDDDDYDDDFDVDKEE